jgi:AcrR family transcriptional regulator
MTAVRSAAPAAAAGEPRELRADAQRNRARVLEAAREVFAEQGVDAPVTVIAERAGVGVATIFRRFPSKDDLLVALISQRGEQLTAVADLALRSDDPGAALRRFVEEAAVQQIGDRGFCDSIGTHLFARDDLRALFDGVRSRLNALVRRAQAAGAVRPDINAEDLLFVLHGVARTGLMLEEIAPGAWRRYLGLALDGLRPEAATPLPRKPLTRRQFDRASSGGSTSR